MYFFVEICCAVTTYLQFRCGSIDSEKTCKINDGGNYHNAGVRVFDIKDPFIPTEMASWVPPVPNKLIGPRPNIALAARTCDVSVTPEGILYINDWNAGLQVLEYKG